jgi:SAM-dependent methyltransferase
MPKRLYVKTCNSITNCCEEKRFFFTKDGFDVMECTKCGHQFAEISDRPTHVSRVYSDNYFFGGHAGYPNYLEERDLLIRCGVRYGKLVAKYTNPGELLDVGCAAGFILKGFQQTGWNVHGIEPNNTMASYGRQNLRLDIETATLESFTSASKYDLITLIQVIGHFYDLDKAIMNAVQLLKEDGMILVESWNRNSIPARIFGRYWQEYSPPSVVHWFSDESLESLFHYYGCEQVANGLPTKRISLNHAISLLETKMPNWVFRKSVFASIRRAFGNLTFYYPPIDLKWYLFKRRRALDGDILHG